MILCCCCTRDLSVLSVFFLKRLIEHCFLLFLIFTLSFYSLFFVNYCIITTLIIDNIYIFTIFFLILNTIYRIVSYYSGLSDYYVIKTGKKLASKSFIFVYSLYSCVGDNYLTRIFFSWPIICKFFFLIHISNSKDCKSLYRIENL